MKFGRFLKFNTIKGWESHYFRYKDIKAVLHNATERLEASEDLAYAELCYMDDEESRRPKPATAVEEKEALLDTMTDEANTVVYTSPQTDPINSMMFTPLLRERRLLYDRVQREMIRVDSFYQSKIKSLGEELDMLISSTASNIRKRNEMRSRQASPKLSAKTSPGDGNGLKCRPYKKDKQPKSPAASYTPDGTMTRTDRFKLAKQHRAELAALHKECAKMKAFATINYTALRKITKKIDKNLPLSRGVSPPSQVDHVTKELAGATFTDITNDASFLAKYRFCSSDDIDELTHRCESAFADFFTNGNHRDAILQLQEHDTKIPFFDMFYFGVNVGLTLAFFLGMYIVSQTSDFNHEHTFVATLPILRVAFCMALFIWCWGFLVYTWHRINLNHVYIFDFNPSNALEYFEILKLASVLTAILAAAFYFYYAATRTSDDRLFGIKYRYFVMVVMIGFAMFLFNPFDVFHRSSRYLLIRLVLQVMASPFTKVRFIHVYIGDVITSMVHPMADLEYTVCYYSSGEYLHDPPNSDQCNTIKKYVLPFVCAAPYIWRGMQNMRRYWETGDMHPHVTNACKYLSGVLVTVMGFLYGDFSSSKDWDAGRVIWILLFFIEVIYMYSWDILMDWGLKPFHKTKHFLLRDELLYPYKWVYYFAIVSNFFARFVWALTITPVPFVQNDLQHEYIVLGLSVCEILRRFQWSFFRVENEFLSNSDQLRSIATVPPPLDLNDFKTPLLSAQNLDTYDMTKSPTGSVDGAMIIPASQRQSSWRSGVRVAAVSNSPSFTNSPRPVKIGHQSSQRNFAAQFFVALSDQEDEDESSGSDDERKTHPRAKTQTKRSHSLNNVKDKAMTPLSASPSRTSSSRSNAQHNRVAGQRDTDLRPGRAWVSVRVPDSLPPHSADVTDKPRAVSDDVM